MTMMMLSETCPPVTVESLAETSLFRNVDLDFLFDRLVKCDRRALVAGEVLLREGQDNLILYVVLSGRLEAHLQLEGTTTCSTVTVELAPGDCVGEMSVIDCRPVTAHVVATESCWLLEIPRELIWLLIDRTTFVSRNLLYILAGRLRQGNLTLNARDREIDRLHQLVHHDALTSVQNRRWFDEQLELAIDQASRTGEPLSLVTLDIDHFKSFNDSYGHAAGDLVLRRVASALGVRAEPHHVARVGGEEFSLILADCDRQQGLELAEGLRAAVGGIGTLSSGGSSLPRISISIGVVQFARGESPAEFANRADEAVYAAKRDGRNCVRAL